MKRIIMIMIMVLVLAVPVSADVDITTNIDSQGGSIDFWANPNSGTGSTTYYIDGIDYQEAQRVAENSRGSIVSRVYKAFMDWKRQPTGEIAWQETVFEDLEPAYQRLRYVLEHWFIKRTEMVQIIQHQQDQITQLQLELETVGKVLGEEKICDARKQVMMERNLPSVTCGDTTWYPNGLGLKVNEDGI